MKKILGIIVLIDAIITTCFLPQTNKSNQNEERFISNVNEQINIMFESIELWDKRSEDESSSLDWYDYALTDLNQNGRLELIIRGIIGSGHFSYNEVYEIDESQSKLIRLPDNLIEGLIGYTIGVGSPETYYDNSKKVYYHVFVGNTPVYNEYTKIPGEYEKATTVVYIEDGMVNYCDIGEYKNKVNENIEELEKKKTTIYWISGDDVSKLSTNEFKEKLIESQKNFSIN